MTDRDATPSRPHVPSGYGIPREPGDAGSWDAVAVKIAASRNYWIASTRPDGRPHVMPVWGVWVDGQFLFATDRASRKGRNIAANPAIVVHLESGDDVVVLEGAPREVTGAELLARYVDAYDAKYAVRPDPGDPTTVTYALRPSVAFTWLEADYLNSATRWSFDQA
jgi:nitroimidazol reductase NimA-like FMN-containing flavoprotein (pyridoxamine 5'-phosphate oxidase superfamily)